MATEFKIYRQTGAETQPAAIVYGNIVILKNGSFWTVNELNQMVKIGPFDDAALLQHLGDAVIHVTQQDKDRWDSVEMAKVFDTVSEMETWLENAENTANLPIGFNFFIRDPDVPDYWWDGEEPVEAATAKVDLTEYLKTANAVDMFVAKETGKRLMTDAEGTKLSGIATGAQVNVLESIKVNGTALTPDGSKAVDITIPTLEIIDF
ncbi:MAG: hypothetical protein FWF92_00570 [Oscillospiraceae bacterium]|nr:hypothetical protein [Oscillospiraceae bacterium]